MRVAYQVTRVAGLVNMFSFLHTQISAQYRKNTLFLIDLPLNIYIILLYI